MAKPRLFVVKVESESENIYWFLLFFVSQSQIKTKPRISKLSQVLHLNTIRFTTSSLPLPLLGQTTTSKVPPSLLFCPPSPDHFRVRVGADPELHRPGPLVRHLPSADVQEHG